jgi:NADH dehydrogenase [ubiquinone] 1 alpha subcomplex assembly factor 7
MINNFTEKINKKILETGPITIAEFMTICLLDPTDGYYPTRDPFGKDGDFITSPEISQMFGELIGLWCMQTWHDMGQPKKINLIEYGPGRGIMMQDIVRVAKLDKGFLESISITLIEASPVLESIQAETLSEAPCPVNWSPNIEEIPQMPSIILGNEFLDCLPIRQFIQTDKNLGLNGWRERLVTVKNNKLGFGISPFELAEWQKKELPNSHHKAIQNDLLEFCPAFSQIIDELKSRSLNSNTRALFIDYGPATTDFGDTLQSLQKHKKINVFSDLGNADLTARVNFEHLANLSKANNLSVTSVITQGEFLCNMGIKVRAEKLMKAKPELRNNIQRQLNKLISQDEMGALFKVICFQSEELGLPLGFESLK